MTYHTSRKKVYYTVFFALVFLLSATACTKNDSTLYNSDPAVLTVSGKTIEVPYALKIDGKKVSLDEYRYHFLNGKYNMDQGDASFWNSDKDGSQQRLLKTQTESALKEAYAIEALAKEYALELTKDERGQIESDVQGQIETLGGAEGYKKALDASFLTDKLYRKVWRTSYQYEKLYSFYFSQDGQFHNSDTTISNDEKELSYQTKLQAIIAEKADQLEIEYGPEYELITIDTLS